MSEQNRSEARIGRTYRDSTPWWPAPAVAPEGAPNILFVVLDDVGYSDLGCFGSEISTPRMDALAAGGLRYNNFHVTAMCSPTRASLLTGRNAHAVGVGAIAEWSAGYPGYQGRITPHAATIAEMLSEHAYGTYAIGKWHLSNLGNYATAGPHEHWPLGKGFSRWFGFMGGFVDHWNPDLHEDNHPVKNVPRKGYHLTGDLVDHAINFVRDHVTSANGRPWLSYLALGAGHWPLHVPPQYIARYKGRYDRGWDTIREERLLRQKSLGIVPADTPLSPRNPGVRGWQELDQQEQVLCARLQETYAAFLEHADTQLGRLIDYLDVSGQLENTVVVLLSDNGASGEGGPTGAVNIRRHVSTEKETVEYGLERLDLIGSEYSFPHYPTGWAQVSNTPLKWFKKNTHGGGIRAPLIVHWPKKIRDAGAIRHQYHHVSDVVPTLLEAIGVQAPQVHKGVTQMPLHGTSFLYSFDAPDAPTRKEIQHFEMLGDRALWQDGWKAVARHQKGDDFEADRWELYRLEQDFAEMQDLASREPERLQSMVERWWIEAERYSVLPLDDRDVERSLAFSRTLPTRYEFQPGMARFDRQLVPPINDRGWRMRAEFAPLTPESRGIVVSCGSRIAGYLLHCQEGQVFFDYIAGDGSVSRLEAPLPTSASNVEIQFVRTGERAGHFILSIDDTPLGRMQVHRTWTVYGISSGLTCGFGNVPVSDACPTPGTFQGNLVRVLVEVSEPSTPADPSFSAALHEE